MLLNVQSNTASKSVPNVPFPQFPVVDRDLFGHNGPHIGTALSSANHISPKHHITANPKHGFHVLRVKPLFPWSNQQTYDDIHAHNCPTNMTLFVK